MNKGRLKGITLVETILYLAVFAVMFVAVMQFVFAVAEANERASLTNDIEKDTVFINQHMKASFTQATSINEIASVFNNADGVLRLNTASSYLEYKIVDNRLNFYNGASTTTISNSNLDLDNFYLERVERDDNSLIGVRLTLNFTAFDDPDVSSGITTSFLLDF